MDKDRTLCGNCGNSFETEKDLYDYIECSKCGKNSSGKMITVKHTPMSCDAVSLRLLEIKKEM